MDARPCLRVRHPLYMHTHTSPPPNSFCFDLLVASLCPAIFGHELVKAGLLLTLLGGTKRQNDAATGAARTRVRVRSDPHILLVVRNVVDRNPLSRERP